ncbi:hypothetical protein EIP86_006005 [Pleurotus ostreatoroseus]|nr:hypothetical protein EIP86_006005 [Pleurotus ostreatoroseus]
MVESPLAALPYVTEIGGVDIWWTGSRLHNLPSHLPSVGKPLTGSAIVPYRYHFNTVTFAYTTVFWDFAQWSLLLDWLALRGVNLPLAWNGYETILSSTLRDFGLSDAEIASFYTGPAFLPWNRFGNIQGSWDGPLPQQWNDDQLALQKRILERMLELGMTPILPAFTGFVPRALQTHFPNASIVNGSAWSPLWEPSLTNVSFLEPFDPLYSQIQQVFIAKQRAAYGNISHFYTLDQYNENNPFSGNISYLTNVSAGTLASLQAADPDAIWVLQGWLFFSSEAFWTDDRIQAYLGGVTDDSKMLILDLYSEAAPQWNRTHSYFGKPWIWCELHGYGGNMGMEGNIPAITQGPIAALGSPGSTMQGMGLSMEGQEPGNEIVYDILLDQAWSSKPLAVAEYVRKWVSRRYLVKNVPDAAHEAWTILSTTVYSNQDPNSQAAIKSILELQPAISGLVNRTGHHPTVIPYDTNTTILPALQLLLRASKANEELKGVPEFAFDVVEITRQLLANRFIDRYNSLVAIFNSSTSAANQVSSAGKPLLAILSDMETLLATNENFLLSPWIEDARRLARGNATYASYLEYNARNQLTLWGPHGENNDYASKQWAGLVGGYYAERWEAFVTYLVSLKKSGGAYNATLVAETMIDIGQKWDNATLAGEASGTRGNTFAVASNIVKRWG